MRAILAALLIIVAARPKASSAVTNIVLPSGVRVEITEAPVRGSGLSVEGCTNVTPVCRIGGNPFVLREIPKTYVRSISAVWKGHTFHLDASGIFDAGVSSGSGVDQPRDFGGGCQDVQTCRFRALFGDAANTIAVEWEVLDGVPKRTVFAQDDDIIGLFLKQIDPPEDDQ